MAMRVAIWLLMQLSIGAVAFGTSPEDVTPSIRVGPGPMGSDRDWPLGLSRANTIADICTVVTGDANYDGQHTSSDIIHLVNHIFKGGPAPIPVPVVGDANCDSLLTSSDIIYMVNFIFKGGSVPVKGCHQLEPVSEIPLGAPVVVDGTLAPGEWSDALAAHFAANGLVDITTMIKHDGSSLLAAYVYRFENEEQLCFPEILIDADHDQSEGWMIDDWWFHVSATDCEAHGAYDVWDDCSVVQPDWQGVPNFVPVPESPPVDTFEIRIPFTKLGVLVGDTVGFALRVECVPSVYLYWPPGTAVESPCRWGAAILKPQTLQVRAIN